MRLLNSELQAAPVEISDEQPHLLSQDKTNGDLETTGALKTVIPSPELGTFRTYNEDGRQEKQKNLMPMLPEMTIFEEELEAPAIEDLPPIENIAPVAGGATR